MIRVTKTEEESRTIITVDGQLSGDFIGAVETCCNQAEANGKPVQLFLRDVTAVDGDGQMLLARLATRGIRLAASGVYTSYLVEALTAAAAAPQSTPAVTEAGVGKAAGGTPRIHAG